jgi:hypothetical protein
LKCRMDIIAIFPVLILLFSVVMVLPTTLLNSLPFCDGDAPFDFHARCTSILLS